MGVNHGGHGDESPEFALGALMQIVPLHIFSCFTIFLKYEKAISSEKFNFLREGASPHPSYSPVAVSPPHTPPLAPN